ncbi:MAG: hypothetical protein M1136_04225 [Chloroflexi bacterium]|nr:hypothetical protein [Chloroflexota bacterium]MCL5074846.1 hypothetical protein [Chloroflexota bacterium]
MEYLVLYSLVLPASGGVVSLLLGRLTPRRWAKVLPAWLAILVLLLNFFVSVRLFLVARGEPLGVVLAHWPAVNYMSYSLNVDGFAATIIAGESLLFLLVALFFYQYIHRYKHANFYYFFLLVISSVVNGAIASADLLTFYVFAVFVSIFCMLLVMIDFEPAITLAGSKLFLMNELPALLLLCVALTLQLGRNTGGFAQVAGAVGRLPDGFLGFSLGALLLALGVRSAVMPLHTWLPGTCAGAVRPIGAILCGGIPLLGLYLTTRIFPPLMTMPGVPDVSGVFLVLGSISILVGIYASLRERDVHRLLCFLSISQIGYIWLGLGLGSELRVGLAIFQMLNYVLILPLLFLGVELIVRVEKGFDPRDWRAQPLSLVSLLCLLIGMLAVVGAPGTNGFAARLLLFRALLAEANLLLLAVALLGVVMMVISLLRLSAILFAHLFAEESVEVSIEQRGEGGYSSSAFALVPLLVLAAGSLLMGLLPLPLLQSVIGPASGLHFGVGVGMVNLGRPFGGLLLAEIALLLAIVSGALLYLLDRGFIEWPRAYALFCSLRQAYFTPLMERLWFWAKEGYFDVYVIVRMLFTIIGGGVAALLDWGFSRLSH